MKKAVIFDLDNTILYQTNRNPFNWSDLSGDVIIPEMEQMIESIVSGNIKLIPENIIIGGENGGSTVENFLGISMIEKLTGKEFNSKPTEDPKLKVAKKEPKA